MLEGLSPTKQRIVIGALVSTLAFLLVYFSYYPIVKPLIFLTIASIVGIALWEFYQITKAKDFEPLVKMGIAASTLYVLAVFLTTFSPKLALLPQIVFFVCFLLIFFRFFFEARQPLLNLAITIFGIVYLALPLSQMIQINYFFPPLGDQQGQLWLFYLILVTKMTDIGGFFIGKKFGKHKLAKYISPKKTIEGSIGGLVLALTTSILFPIIINSYTDRGIELSLQQSIYLGIGMGVLAQIGDLGESLLKRDAGVKDSNQLPGLGGFLDMVDSLIFTTPLIYFFLQTQYG